MLIYDCKEILLIRVIFNNSVSYPQVFKISFEITVLPDFLPNLALKGKESTSPSVNLFSSLVNPRSVREHDPDLYKLEHTGD